MASTAMKNELRSPAGRRWSGSLALLVLALGLTAGYYYVLWTYVPADSLLVRYTAGHPIEYVEVSLFFWGMVELAAKCWSLGRQYSALGRRWLPAEAQGLAAAKAGQLLAELDRLPRRERDSLLAGRIRSAMEFVAQRGSAAGLDEYLRARSDADANAVEGSYSLIKFITWAIPILGFLGTVLGIAAAVANVTPEQLATSIAGVTGGLAVAFDTTAVALMFSMCLMFLTFVVDRGEQRLLQAVDAYVEEHLVHRFERPAAAALPAGVLEQAGSAVFAWAEKLLRRQAEIWQESLGEFHRQAEERDRQRFEQTTAALAQMLERTAAAHQARLRALEAELHGQMQSLTPQFDRIAAGLGRLADMVDRQAERTAEQTRLLGGLVEGEKQILRLQETLHATLHSLADAATLERVLHSLTAAVHLLTARCDAAGRPAIVVPTPTAIRGKGQAA